MDARRFLATLVFGLLLTHAVEAQDSLTLFVPVTGTLASGETASWTLQAADGAMLSFHASATSGDLDPVLTISDSTGNVVLNDDDFDYPDSPDALLEGVTMPRTDTYTVTLSGYGDTAGAYEVTVLAGFAQLARQEIFEDASLWDSRGSALETISGNNRLALIISGTKEQGIATYAGDNTWDDAYIYVEVPELAGANGWQVGLIARQQDAETYYLYSLNDRGQWRFAVHTAEGERVVRDWSEHPAIVPGQTPFSLGLLTNGAGFDFFYNGQPVGRLTDRTISEPGRVALWVETPPTLGSEVTAQFQNLTITTPLAHNLLPDQLQTGASPVMVQELQRRRLIPAAGQMGLVVPESYVTFNRPGVNELPLGSSETFRTFALGTTVTWETSTPDGPQGCGLTLRSADQDHYILAYLDQTGAYGLAQREGDQFEPGLFGQGLSLPSGPQRLLVIAEENQLAYYINGQLVGQLQREARAGRVGNAVVNFESATTSCQFGDTWVWSWE